jgi:hypothetical protein
MRDRKKINMVNERQEEGQKVKEMQEEDKIKYRQKEIKRMCTRKTKVKHANTGRSLH